MLSPPEPLDEIQPNLVCELLTWMGRTTKKKFWPRLLGPWGGVKYHLISITKSISKIFIPSFVCVLTNERYKTYQTGFYPNTFFKKARGYCTRLRPAVCPLCYLLLNHWTKFIQIWCVSYSHEWGVQRKKFFGPASWGREEGSNII